ERVSVDSDGTQGNGLSRAAALSADGRYVAFFSVATNLVPDDTNGWSDVFVHDRETGKTERVSVASDGTQGNGSSRDPALSADGRYVAFGSNATNLPEDVDSNGPQYDLFVYDRHTRHTELVNVASDGTQGGPFNASPVLSADGQFVAF